MKVELTQEQWEAVLKALSMSSAFAVYGDGREDHRKDIKEIEDAINLQWVREYIPL